MRGHAKRQRATMARGGVRKRHVVRGDRAVQRNSMRGHIHRPWAHRTWEKREEVAHIADGVRAFGTPHHSTGRTILTRAPMARTMDVDEPRWLARWTSMGAARRA